LQWHVLEQGWPVGGSSRQAMVCQGWPGGSCVWILFFARKWEMLENRLQHGSGKRRQDVKQAHGVSKWVYKVQQLRAPLLSLICGTVRASNAASRDWTYDAHLHL